MFLNWIAEAAEPVNGVYPGGANASDPVPTSVAYYANEWVYGGLMFATLALLVFLVTRLNIDR
jgi:hypothetical protein